MKVHPDEQFQALATQDIYVAKQKWNRDDFGLRSIFIRKRKRFYLNCHPYRITGDHS